MYRRSVGLTDKERTLLDAILEEGTLQGACELIGIKPNAGYQRLSRLRRRYERAKEFVNNYEEYQDGFSVMVRRVYL